MWKISQVPNYCYLLFRIFHISLLDPITKMLFLCFRYFPHFTQKNLETLFVCVKCGKYPKSRTIGICCFVFSIFHFQKYQNVVFGFLVFSTFHLQESDFVSYENFPHLLCRFSGARSSEHFVIACILLSQRFRLSERFAIQTSEMEEV